MAHHIYSLFISCRKDFFDKKNCPLLSQRAILEAPPRFELGIRVLQTHALPLGYSAIVFTFVKSQACFTKVKTLPPLLRGLWSGLRGSNSLPPPWQGGALPDELNPRYGYESRVHILGASGRNRTNDTRIFSPLLDRLSYRGKFGDPDGARTHDL